MRTMREGPSLTYRDLMMLMACVILPGRCEILHMYAVISKQATGSKAEDRRVFLVSWLGSCI